MLTAMEAFENAEMARNLRGQTRRVEMLDEFLREHEASADVTAPGRLLKTPTGGRKRAMGWSLKGGPQAKSMRKGRGCSRNNRGSPFRWTLLASFIGALITGIASCRPRSPVDIGAGANPWTGETREAAPPRLNLESYKSVQRRPRQNPDLALAIAISGGGHRAANFAIGVLLELEELATPHGNALAEVDYFSTVSGGGFAVAPFLSRLFDHLSANPTGEAFRFAEAFYRHGEASDLQCDNMVRNLERGYHNVLFGNLADPCASPDGSGGGFFGVLKLAGQLDRGDLFEAALDQRTLGAWGRERSSNVRLSLSLDDLFVRRSEAHEPRFPMWVANGTIFENGAILQFTPDVIDVYKVCSVTHRMRVQRLSNGGNLPLAVGMKASASFPGVVPATTLGCHCENGKPTRFLRVLDGGIADNLGVLTALDLLGDEKENSEHTAPRTRVLLVIDAYNGESRSFSATESPPTFLATALRMTDISLDSWRGRHRDITNALAERDKVQIVFVSFDDLENAEYYDKIRSVKTRLDVNREIQATLIQAGRDALRSKRTELTGIFGH